MLGGAGVIAQHVASVLSAGDAELRRAAAAHGGTVEAQWAA